MSKDNPLSYNIGSSNYSELKVQPWELWSEFNLNGHYADIVKRLMRTKKVDGELDLPKIMHIIKYLRSKAYNYSNKCENAVKNIGASDEVKNIIRDMLLDQQPSVLRLQILESEIRNLIKDEKDK